LVACRRSRNFEPHIGVGFHLQLRFQPGNGGGHIPTVLLDDRIIFEREIDFGQPDVCRFAPPVRPGLRQYLQK